MGVTDWYYNLKYKLSPHNDFQLPAPDIDPKHYQDVKESPEFQAKMKARHDSAA